MFTERGAFFGGDVADRGESGEAGGEIGGVVVVLAMIRILEFAGRCHVGGITLDMEAVRGDLREGLQGFLFARMEEVAREREMGTELDEGGDHRRRTAEAVQ